MKKSIYILTLIIISLLSMGATVQAQFLESTESLRLSIYPSDLIVRGSFNIKTDNPLKEYFVNIDGVIRIGDNSIKLKKKYQPHARIRIEVNKGRLNLSGISKVTKSKSSQGIVEGRLETPVDINFWTVNQLNIDDKDITISIFDINTEQLLEEKTYKLKPDTVRGCPYPKLCYTNLAGEEVKFTYGKIGDDIDYSKPMKIVVEDIWGKTYKVCSHRVEYTYRMCEMMMPSDGDTLTEKEKSVIRELPKGKFIYISDIIAEQNGRKYNKSPIEIRK
ncbi:MAG: hypothetical protein UH071_02700 [Paludibacteraceae bacterium]|nr:hypothetical protein [Paludibacteraceae bacterium]